MGRSKNKDQHYVAASYLYHFTNDAERSIAKNLRETRISYLDKTGGTIKTRPVRKCVTESYLYSYKNVKGEWDHSLDDEIQRVEAKTANAIRETDEQVSIALAASCNEVKLEDWIFDVFLENISWQIKRHHSIIQSITESLEEYGEQAKRIALKVVKNIGAGGEMNFKSLFNRRKKAILCAVGDDNFFVTSDNPICGFRKDGPNGIGYDETEIYFPISRDYLLLLYGVGYQEQIHLHLEYDNSFFMELNRCLSRNAERYVFSPSESYLEVLRNEC